MGVDLVQPRPRRDRRPGRLPRETTSRAGVRRRHARLRGGVACLRARHLVRRPRRSPLRAGRRRGAARLRRPRPPHRDRRHRRARRSHLGEGGRARRGARPGGGRDPHGDARLGVDLPRAGAARSRSPSPAVWRLRVRPLVVPCGPPERARQSRAAPRLGRPHRRALPARAPARRRLAHLARRRRA